MNKEHRNFRRRVRRWLNRSSWQKLSWCKYYVAFKVEKPQDWTGGFEESLESAKERAGDRGQIFKIKSNKI